MSTAGFRRAGFFAAAAAMMTCAPMAVAIEAIDVEPHRQPPAACKASERPFRGATHSLTAPAVAPVKATGTILIGTINGTGKIVGGAVNGSGTILTDTVNGAGRFLGGLISLPPKPGIMGDGLVKPVTGAAEGTVEIAGGVVEGTVKIGTGVVEAGVKIVDGVTAPFVFAVNATVRASGLADRPQSATEIAPPGENTGDTEMILQESETPVD